MASARTDPVPAPRGAADRRSAPVQPSGFRAPSRSRFAGTRPSPPATPNPLVIVPPRQEHTSYTPTAWERLPSRRRRPFPTSVHTSPNPTAPNPPSSSSPQPTSESGSPGRRPKDTSNARTRNSQVCVCPSRGLSCCADALVVAPPVPSPGPPAPPRPPTPAPDLPPLPTILPLSSLLSDFPSELLPDNARSPHVDDYHDDGWSVQAPSPVNPFGLDDLDYGQFDQANAEVQRATHDRELRLREDEAHALRVLQEEERVKEMERERERREDEEERNRVRAAAAAAMRDTLGVDEELLSKMRSVLPLRFFRRS